MFNILPLFITIGSPLAGPAKVAVFAPGIGAEIYPWAHNMVMPRWFLALYDDPLRLPEKVDPNRSRPTYRNPDLSSVRNPIPANQFFGGYRR